MKLLLLGPLIFCLIAQFKTEAHPISIEERAVDLVIAKYDKQLKKRIQKVKAEQENLQTLAWDLSKALNDGLKITTNGSGKTVAASKTPSGKKSDSTAKEPSP